MRGADSPIGRPPLAVAGGSVWPCSRRPSMLYTPESRILPGGVRPMGHKPVAIDHVNIFVRNAERSYQWYKDVFGFHTQDIFNHPGTDKPKAVFLASDPDHAHDIALFEVGEDAALQQKNQV